MDTEDFTGENTEGNKQMETGQQSVATGTQEVSEDICQTNRHPWLGVFLNCFAFSGAGYLYCREYQRAALAMLGTMTIYAGFYGLVFVRSLSFTVLVSLAVLSYCGLKTLISVDVFAIIRRRNTAEFESLRKSQKDAWLTVSLANFYLPLALIYLRKWRLLVAVLIIGLAGWYFLEDNAGENTPPFYGEFVLLGRRLVAFGVGLFCFWLARKGVKSPLCHMRSFLRYGAIAAMSGVVWIGIRLAVSTTTMQAYNMSYESMEPTIKPGDRVVVSKLAYLNKQPKPGDVVVFRTADYNLPYVKRVLATAGQVVDMTEEGVLLVDGHEVSCDGLVYSKSQADRQAREYVDGFVVPEGLYYVVGDDLPCSFDSRAFGPVSKQQIIGKVVRVFNLPW